MLLLYAYISSVVSKLFRNIQWIKRYYPASRTNDQAKVSQIYPSLTH